MLTGAYKHPLDPKGRCVMPKPLRSQMGETVYLTRGVDNSIWVFPEDAWQGFVHEIGRRPTFDRDGLLLSRYFLGTAHRVSFDRLGRLQIPAALRGWAGLEDEVMISGVGSRVEIWSAKAWEAHMAEMSAERIRDFGLEL